MTISILHLYNWEVKAQCLDHSVKNGVRVTIKLWSERIKNFAQDLYDPRNPVSPGFVRGLGLSDMPNRTGGQQRDPSTLTAMPQVDENGNFLVYIPENGYPTMSSDENADENDFWKRFLKIQK